MSLDPPIIDFARPPEPDERPLPWWMKVATLTFILAAVALVQCVRAWAVNGPTLSAILLGLILAGVVLELGVTVYRSAVAAAILAALWLLVPTCCLAPGMMY